MAIKWSPGCSCCGDVSETCEPVNLLLTNPTGSALDSDWTYTGAGTPSAVGIQTVSVFALTGVTTMTPVHLAGRYNEAFTLTLQARQGSAGAPNAKVTIKNGTNELIVDLKADTLTLNGAAAKSIGTGSDDVNNFTYIQMSFNPERIIGSTVREVSKPADEWYEIATVKTMTAFDVDETPAAFSPEGFTIEVDAWVQIKDVVYQPTTVIWPSGDAVATVNCGCGLLPANAPGFPDGKVPIVDFYDGISKLNAAITGSAYPSANYPTYPTVVAQRWNFLRGGFWPFPEYSALAVPLEVWNPSLASWDTAFTRGYVHLIDPAEGLVRYRWYNSGVSIGVFGNGITERNAGQASLDCLAKSYVVCPEPTAGDPYPMPQQRTIFLASRSDSSGNSYSCGTLAATSVTTIQDRDITDVASSFSIAAVLPAISSTLCPNATWMQSSTTVTLNWPGS